MSRAQGHCFDRINAKCFSQLFPGPGLSLFYHDSITKGFARYQSLLLRVLLCFSIGWAVATISIDNLSLFWIPPLLARFACRKKPILMCTKTTHRLRNQFDTFIANYSGIAWRGGRRYNANSHLQSANGTQFIPLQWLFFSSWFPFDCQIIEIVTCCSFCSMDQTQK